MSFINGLKRAFGFSSDDDYDGEDEGENNSGADTSNSDDDEVSVEVSGNNASADYDTLADELFTKLIDIINAPLPELVRECVDCDAQKRLIYNKLGGSLSKFLEDSMAKSMVDYVSKWEQERDVLKKTVTDLENKNKDFKTHADEVENKGLSAERQKRAMNERCQDLEKRVVNLEAELEQLQLINMSLTNKVKVAKVQSDDSEYYRNEIERLKGEIVTLTKTNEEQGAVDNNTTNESSIISELREKLSANVAEIEALQQQISGAKELNLVAENEKSELTKQIETLNATILANLQSTSTRESVLNDEVTRLYKEQEVRASKAIDTPIEMDTDEITSLSDSVDYVNIDAIAIGVDEISVKPKKRSKRAKKSVIEPIAFEDKKSSKISAIDESLENLDWLVPSPMCENKPSKVVDEDFAEKIVAKDEDTSLQMSLF